MNFARHLGAVNLHEKVFHDFRFHRGDTVITDEAYTEAEIRQDNLLWHKLDRAGIFPNLTVEENLSVVVSSAPRVELQRIEEAVFTYFPRIAGLRKRAAGLLSGSAEALKSNPRVQSSTWAAAATAIPIWKAPSVAGRSASMPCVSAAWWCSTRSRSASPRASCWR